MLVENGIEAGPNAAQQQRFHRLWLDLALPLVAAVVVLGPALGPGALFNLDFIVVPHLDVPAGLWGLGPELPRRVPMWVPIAWLSHLVPATVTVKLLLVAVFVAAWAGVARWSRTLGVRWPYLAAALYAFSPFLLTRMAVGHLMVVVPMAILPWVIGPLLHPGRVLGSTFLAAALLGFTGHFGGSVALLVVVVAVVCGSRERWVAAIAVTIAAQAQWVVPGVAVVLTSPGRLATGAAFGTDLGSGLGGVLGVLRLPAGAGFWNGYFQVGEAGLLPVLLGAVLLGLAALGSGLLPLPVRRAVVTLGVLGWLVAAASALPGISRLFDTLTDNVVFGIWRESQRLLVLHLLWLAPAATFGAQKLYDRAMRSSRRRWTAEPVAMLLGVIAVVLAAPGVWGIGGQLHAVAVPDGWDQARSLVRSEPGTVLALPWYQYFNQRLGDGTVRRVLNPMPLFLGGDVLASSDSGLAVGVRERSDPREPIAGAAVRALIEQGDRVSPTALALGVRWVVLQKSVPLLDESLLESDPGLRRVVDSPELALYEVIGWAGPAVRDDGTVVEVRSVGDPVHEFVGADDDAVVWYQPAAGGWRRGLEPAGRTAQGLVRFEGGSGTVWNVATPPSLVALAANWIAFALVLRRRLRRLSI